MKGYLDSSQKVAGSTFVLAASNDSEDCGVGT